MNRHVPRNEEYVLVVEHFVKKKLPVIYEKIPFYRDIFKQMPRITGERLV